MNEPTNDWWSTHPLGGAILVIVRGVGAVVGLFLFVISIPLTISPIPLGLPLMIVSLILLAATSRRAHRIITGYLKRHPGIWERFKHVFGGDKDHDATP
ncbi:hypothetical protein E5163_15910 [Marinicauda algicola]|uniref:Uncharacterized protein n=1 Tax=Marinicauda algicola TaxID=2029849 RepID=A0A4S2GVW1_9PROT|nr:hypothetical protein [Marinicauda algicola]TGY87205.1 hypothetical protein E5163_15910 [Marinicauda algicola]